MLSIGAFATIGQVSVRMLRHWDLVGLLRPADVDEWSGYRYYSADQVERLNRIVALRDLGFGIDDVARLLDEGIDASELAGLLRKRRERDESDYRTAEQQLAEVTRRLQYLEKEKTMHINVVTKPLPSIRLIAATATVADRPGVGEVIESLFGDAAEAVVAAGGNREIAIAAYDETDAGLTITAGFGYSGAASAGVEVLPAADLAACAVHRGEMSGVSATWHALHMEIIEQGLTPVGQCRENYIRAVGDDQSDWVVELQQPVTR